MWVYVYLVLRFFLDQGIYHSTYKVLMRQVQRPRRILLHAEMQRLHARLARSIGRVLQELQTCATEALLLLEDALIFDGDLKGSVVRGVETRLCDVGELEDSAPLEIVALDIVGVVDGVRGVCVELGRVSSPGCGDTAVEDDRALDVCAGTEPGGSEGAGGAEHEEERLHCGDLMESGCTNSLGDLLVNPALTLLYPSFGRNSRLPLCKTASQSHIGWHLESNIRGAMNRVLSRLQLSFHRSNGRAEEFGSFP